MTDVSSIDAISLLIISDLPRPVSSASTTPKSLFGCEPLLMHAIRDHLLGYLRSGCQVGVPTPHNAKGSICACSRFPRRLQHALLTSLQFPGYHYKRTYPPPCLVTTRRSGPDQPSTQLSPFQEAVPTTMALQASECPRISSRALLTGPVTGIPQKPKAEQPVHWCYDQR
jgi:hypothetical protein